VEIIAHHGLSFLLIIVYWFDIWHFLWLVMWLFVTEI
jgi:hypothetical protein